LDFDFEAVRGDNGGGSDNGFVAPGNGAQAGAPAIGMADNFGSDFTLLILGV
jgi:hypothetical protein